MNIPKFVKSAFLLFTLTLLVFGGCKNQNSAIMNQPGIEQFDLQKYLGKWYEIARYDHRFERGLEGVTASYSLREDGKIRVLNAGYKNSLDGKYKEAVGKAKTTDTPGKLKVSFFWFFYSDYIILELDEDYQWALIGSSSDNYLWILSRTPQLNEQTKENILSKARARGYNTSKLIWVKQKSE
jgi:lipocalin